MAPEKLLEGKSRPYTGAEYLASLKDGREVYIYGERVKDVTEHPAFRNASRSVAKLYDALHDPKTKGMLTCPTDTGNGGYTQKFFRAARSREDLVAQRDAIAAWARITYGWMGRSPDYKAAFLNTLGARHELYEMNYAGGHELVRWFGFFNAQQTGTLNQMVGFAEQCMADYDENGWVDKDYE